MEEQKKHEEKMKKLRQETRLLRERRTEKDRPTVWFNKKLGLIEIQYKNKTVLAEVTGVDTETPRSCAEEMAKGSNFKQVIYQTVEDEE